MEVSPMPNHNNNGVYPFHLFSIHCNHVQTKSGLLPKTPRATAFAKHFILKLVVCKFVRVEDSDLSFVIPVSKFSSFVVIFCLISLGQTIKGRLD